jgi:CheY-like chemotaxis protein
MQVIRSFEQDNVAMVGRAVHALLLTSEGETGMVGLRLASLGARVDVVDELFEALSDLIDDPTGYALFVVDCDAPNVGGLEAAQRAMKMLGDVTQRVSVILISSECHDQRFPQDRTAPVVLRAPMSAVSMKVGYEHALRERLLYQAA